MRSRSPLPIAALRPRRVPTTPAAAPALPAPAPHPARDRRRGTTLLELLVVLGVLGIMTSLGALGLRPPPARLVANAVHAAVQQARFDAIRANRPMVVSIDVGARTVSVSSVANAATIECAAATLVRTVSFADVGRADVEATGFPIVWLPSGQPRTCSGAPFGLAGVDVGVSDQYRTLTVNVGAGGEVVVQ